MYLPTHEYDHNFLFFKLLWRNFVRVRFFTSFSQKKENKRFVTIRSTNPKFRIGPKLRFWKLWPKIQRRKSFYAKEHQIIHDREKTGTIDNAKSNFRDFWRWRDLTVPLRSFHSEGIAGMSSSGKLIAPVFSNCEGNLFIEYMKNEP